MTYYGTLSGANTYFSERLHSSAWDDSDAADRPKALQEATRTIDQLNYKGVKAAVYSVLYDSDGDPLNPAPTQSEIDTANASQELEFPRGRDSATPTDVEYSCYEIAYSLLDGVDPQQELENLRVKSNVYASVRTTYADGYENLEHILYGIPSATAWRWLKPFLDDDQSITLSRAN